MWAKWHSSHVNHGITEFLSTRKSLFSALATVNERVFRKRKFITCDIRNTKKKLQECSLKEKKKKRKKITLKYLKASYRKEINIFYKAPHNKENGIHRTPQRWSPGHSWSIWFTNKGCGHLSRMGTQQDNPWGPVLVAAITNHHKLYEKNQFLKSRCWQGCVPSGGPREESVSLSFPDSRCCLHFLACGSFLESLWSLLLKSYLSGPDPPASLSWRSLWL